MIANEQLWANIAQIYYNMGFYTTETLADWVKWKKLSPETFKNITGVDYEAGL
ncbi:XkdX family protein [Lactobacillus sp.]|uniref:XkdX family protein n=1 Tax=Lactobacillus sp. TaxID=1591 RepID=UPI00198464FA|nr:XkdX family protein [Lactobacillus sp.]MBD5430155.1 XkdX family protein [Lactobacillus sp.]